MLDGGAVVIRGVPKGGPPPERTLALTNINAPRLARLVPIYYWIQIIFCYPRRPNNQLPEGGTDEPFAWEAREFLRKLVVGKTVLGNVVHTANNRWSSDLGPQKKVQHQNLLFPGTMVCFTLEKIPPVWMLRCAWLRRALPPCATTAQTRD